MYLTRKRNNSRLGFFRREARPITITFQSHATAETSELIQNLPTQLRVYSISFHRKIDRAFTSRVFSECDELMLITPLHTTYSYVRAS